MTTKTETLSKLPLDYVQNHILSSRIVANNTFEITDDEGRRIIRLHYTNILTFQADGSIVLNTNGWRTVTTKARMNEYLPRGLAIYSVQGFWYLSYRPDYSGEAWTVPYEDNMVIPADYSKPAVDPADHAEKKRLKKLIDKMCRTADKLAKDRMLPTPSPGDCWLCVVENGADMRLSETDPTRNMEHIVSHLEEQYLHGRLIYNAYLWAGYREEQMRWVYGSRVGSILRRYLKARVGLG